MTVQELYERAEGNYNLAIERFRSDENLVRFLKEYAKDDGYEKLCAAFEERDIRNSFEAAHGEKGVISNFYLTPLFDSICELVEQLRPLEPVSDDTLFQKFCIEHDRMMKLIQNLD